MTHAAAVTDEQDLRTVREQGVFEVCVLAYLTGWSTGDRLSNRKVFELVDLDDRRYGDAATVLSIPIGTVRSRLFRARHLLRAALRDQRVQSA